MSEPENSPEITNAQLADEAIKYSGIIVASAATGAVIGWKEDSPALESKKQISELRSQLASYNTNTPLDSDPAYTRKMHDQTQLKLQIAAAHKVPDANHRLHYTLDAVPLGVFGYVAASWFIRKAKRKLASPTSYPNKPFVSSLPAELMYRQFPTAAEEKVKLRHLR